MDQLSEGQQLENQYRGAGFSNDEINDWKSNRVQQYQKAGFTDQDINKYFGVKETDTSAMKTYVDKNLAAFHESRKAADGTPQKESATFGEAFDAGWENSVSGLAKAGHLPDTVLPEHAPFFHRIASNLGQIAGDIPAMWAGATAGASTGAIAGGFAGSAVPGIGTLAGIGAGGIVGAGAGAFAAPAAIRKMLMDHYERGDIQSAGEFTSRLAATTWEAVKGGTVGALTSGAGMVVKPGMQALGAELATMTTASAAMEGRLPEPQEFIDGAVILGGFHVATGGVPSKLRNIFAATGERPAEIIEAAHQDPVLKQKLLSENNDLPKQAMPAQALPPDFRTVYHGTNAKFESFDYSRSGGMVHFAENKSDAEKYSMDTGSGGRRSLKPAEISLQEQGGAESQEPLQWDKKEKAWINADKTKVVTPEDLRADHESGEHNFVPFPKDARVIEQQVDMNKVLDATTPEGLQKLKESLTPGNPRVNQTIREIDRELSKEPGAPGFGHHFWTLSKLARGDEINSGLKEITRQLKAAGYEGIRFSDDSHKTVAVFDNGKTEVDKALGGNQPTNIDITGEGNRRKNEGTSATDEPTRDGEPKALVKSREAVLSRIGEQPKPEGPKFGSRDWISEKFDKFYQQFIDRLDPISEATKASDLKLNPEENPYVLARNFPGWKGKAEHFFKSGTIDFKTGEKNGEGLEQILLDVKPEEQQDFMAFAMSKRALERAGEFKETGISTKDAKAIVGADQSRFGERFQRLVDYSDRVMNYAVDSELISREVYNRIKKGSGDYIPLLREQDLDEFTGQAKGNGAGLYQEMEGSKRKILNPMEQFMRNTMRVVKAADLNNIKKSFGDMIENSEHGFALAEKIERATGADNEISFKRDGETVTYKTMPEYAEAIKSLNADPGKTALWARMLMGPASWLRTGTVLNPDFIVRHGERAMFVSAVQSKSSGLGSVFKAPAEVAKVMYGNLEAIGNIWKKDDSYQAFLRSGGAQSSIFGIEDYLNKQNIWDLNKESGNFLSRTWNSALSPLEYMAHLSDNIARVAEFKRAGGVEGDLNTKISAGLQAREVTLDYMRAGAQIKAVSSFVPFMNIGIQGMDRMIRGWKSDPIGFTARASAALTIPTLLNWAANRNDSRYQDAPNWEKDLYWIIPTNKWESAANIADAMSRPEDLRRQKSDGTWEVNNGTTLRISKPFELGLLFASVPERLLNRFADHDPRAAGELVGTLLHGALPNVLPTALTPLLEQGTNRKFFTGHPVVSSHAEGLLPEYQYNEYTSTVAKQLGKIIGYVPGLRDIGPKNAKLASPQVIDNYIHDWSGTLGQYALQLVGATERGLGAEGGVSKPTMTLADVPIIKAFIARHPSQKLQPIQDFYEDFDKATRISNTVKDLMKKGDPASYQEAIDLSQKFQGDMVRLTPVKTALGTLAKSIQAVNEHPAMSPNDKRQAIDSMYYQMSMIAKQGNRIIDANRKALNAQQ